MMTALHHHGGRIDEAALRYPDAPRPWIDLSTGINPVPWTAPPGLAIDWGPLPSPAALARLEASAARVFGAPPEAVAAVPGTEIALRLLARLGLPAPFQVGTPGYRTHGAALPDATPVTNDGALRPGATLLIANPNNPDGRIRDAGALAILGAGRWLIVDEAFADVDPRISIVPRRTDRTIVLRSFGKFFGLAGLRLGFVIGPAGIIAAVRRLLGDWPVSAAAITFGIAAYRDTDWIAATRVRLATAATALDQVLRGHGLEPRGACPLFRLVTADASLFGRLARAGILTRPFDYAPDWLRIGLPADDAALARLDRALAHG